MMLNIKNGTARRALAALVAWLMLVGIAVVAASSEPLAAQADEAGAAAAGTPALAMDSTDHRNWQPVTGFNAVWKDENGNPTSLNEFSVYWSDEWMTLRITQQMKKGDLYPMLMSNTYAYDTEGEYDTAAGQENMVNHVVMYFQATSKYETCTYAYCNKGPFGTASTGTDGKTLFRNQAI